MEHRWHGHHRMHPRVMKEETKAAASTRCSPLRSMVFKISNDSIVICRYPSDTAPWDSAMDHGNLADLAAFVLADRASFLCEGASRRWVNRVILTKRRSLRSTPISRQFQSRYSLRNCARSRRYRVFRVRGKGGIPRSGELSRGLRPSQNPSNRCASCFRCHGCSGHRV